MAAKVTVIADASPLIALAMIDRLALLPQLFGTVKVVHTVCQEIMTGQFDSNERSIAHAVEQGWILPVADVAPDLGSMPVEAVSGWRYLDPGEAASISLAWSASDTHSVLIDETAGRSMCSILGLPFLGTAGMLGLAKANGLFPSAKAELERLHAAGFWISANLVRLVLARVGEA